MVDPWEGRAKEMRCITCIYWARKGDKVAGDRGAIGRCRANPPTMKGFPVVYATDWCGYHKLDEDKI